MKLKDVGVKALEVKNKWAQVTEPPWGVTPRLRAVRFRSPQPMTQRSEILEDVQRLYDEYCFVEDLLDECCQHRFKKLTDVSQRMACSLMENTLDRGETAARLARMAMDLDFETGPVGNLADLLESKGVRVRELPKSAPQSFYGLSLNPAQNGPMIVVNTHKHIPVEHPIFAAAVELGHLILHPGDYEIEEQKEMDQHKKEAFEFASFFLMPKKVFKEKWDESHGFPFCDRVLILKNFFSVGYKNVLHRLATDYGEGADAWRRFYVKYFELYKNMLISEEELDYLKKGVILPNLAEFVPTQEPDPLVALDFKPNRLRRLVHKAVHELGELTVNRGAEILGISNTEMYLG